MAPEIRMRANLSGSRDGKKWPPRGGTLEVPEDEAKQLIGQGIAEPADAVETATLEAAAETATVKAPGKSVAQVRADAKAQQEETERLAAEALTAADEKAAAEAAEATRLEAEAKAAAESKGAKK